MMTIAALDRVAAAHPAAVLVVHVDDISASVTERGAMACARSQQAVDDMIVDEIERED